MTPLEDARFAALTVIGVAIGVPLALFLMRATLTILLRKRVPASHLPDVFEPHRTDSLTRFLSLIGYGGDARETLGVWRLRPTLGLKLVFIGGTALLVVVSIAMNARLIGPEALIVAVGLYFTLHALNYEITYDRDTISLPRWWFGRTTRKWRDLDAIVEGRGWYLRFHFRDGRVIQAHKYIVGFAALKETAAKALRED